jgi:hypothetical protein
VSCLCSKILVQLLRAVLRHTRDVFGGCSAVPPLNFSPIFGCKLSFVRHVRAPNLSSSTDV